MAIAVNPYLGQSLGQWRSYEPIDNYDGAQGSITLDYTMLAQAAHARPRQGMWEEQAQRTPTKGIAGLRYRTNKWLRKGGM